MAIKSSLSFPMVLLTMKEIKWNCLGTLYILHCGPVHCRISLRYLTKPSEIVNFCYLQAFMLIFQMKKFIFKFWTSVLNIRFLLMKSIFWKVHFKIIPLTHLSFQRQITIFPSLTQPNPTQPNLTKTKLTQPNPT